MIQHQIRGQIPAVDGEDAARREQPESKFLVPARGRVPQADPEAEMVEVLQAATRMLAGVALRSLDLLDGAVSLPQFRVLAVLADLGPARSGRVARALGLEPSTMTRLADRLVAAGHIRRGSDPGNRSVVMLTLTPEGQDKVAQVEAWRRAELSRLLGQLAPDDRAAATRALSLLIQAADDGYGPATDGLNAADRAQPWP